MTIRILVVEDHASWRHHISSALRQNPHYLVIGEAADGLEALQKAERLKPDLIILDVGLPSLNGIEVARRILALAPDSKILFVSAHLSPDIAEAALQTGAHGYVVKSDAGSELLPAVDAIIQGKPFVSARFAGQVFGRTSRGPVLQAARQHEVLLCSNEAILLDGFARFVADALEAGNAAIAVTTSSHRHTLHQRVRACGLDVDLAIEDGRYVWMDVADSISEILVEGWPDETRFWNSMATLMATATGASKAAHPRVAACGECSPTLLRAGNAAAAVRLEQLWDDAARTYDVDVLCGYGVTAPLLDGEQKIFQRICAAHSAVHSR